MLVLLACILLNASIGVIFKLFERYKIDNLQAIVTNYFICVLTAAILTGESPVRVHVFQQPWFFYAIFLGASFIVVFTLMAVTVQEFGMMVATIFQKMSLIAPTILAILWYKEEAGIMKWLGIASSIAAIIMLSYQKKNVTSKVDITDNRIYLLPAMTFIGSCLIDSALFLVGKNNIAKEGDIQFLSFLFLSAGLIGLLILIIQVFRKNTILAWRNVLAGICLGVPNFFSIYLLLLALQQGWGGSVVFPVNNVGVLVSASFLGLIIFKEKLNPYKITGFILSIFAIICIAFS